MVPGLLVDRALNLSETVFLAVLYCENNSFVFCEERRENETLDCFIAVDIFNWTVTMLLAGHESFLETAVACWILLAS